MKYAFMSFSCPQLSLGEMLSLAKEYGYDAIEPRAGSGHSHDVELAATPAQRAWIKTRVADSGISLACLAVSCRYADPATTQAQVDETRRYLDLAADIGAPRLRVFGGAIGGDLSREAAIDQVTNALRSVAAHAAERNVTICLETHDDWCDPAHVAEVMRRTDHPAIAVNWDIMHPIRRTGGTMDDAFETLQPWIRHVHIHDGSADPNNLTLLPIGQGDINHRRALELLIADNYDGYISGEWIGWEPYKIHLPRELAAMKAYEAEIA
jgi:sugar phosphate isomerase/epimerase